jgi:hypothetical protein
MECKSKIWHMILVSDGPLFRYTHSFHSCGMNEHSAINNRVVFIRECEMTEGGRELVDWLVDHLISLRGKVPHVSMDNENRSYEELWTGAQARLARQEYEDHKSAQPTSADMSVYVFAKVETAISDANGMLDGIYNHTADFKAPRAIQAMRPYGNLWWCRVVRPIEDVFYYAFSLLDLLPRYSAYGIFGKGKNSFETAKMLLDNWKAFRAPVALGMDASRADAHLGLDLHLAKFRIFEFMTDKEGSKFIRNWKKKYLFPTKVLMHGGKLRTRTVLCSGFMDTSLANNVCFYLLHTLYALALRNAHGVADAVKRIWPEFETAERSNYTVLINGDDCVPIVEKCEYKVVEKQAKKFFSLFGVKMKVEEPAFILEEVQWCQHRPVEYREGKWRMTRDPYRIFNHGFSSVEYSNLKEEKLRKRLWNVGVCEKICNISMPIGQSIANSMIRNGIAGTSKKVPGVEYRARLDMPYFGGGEVRVLKDDLITTRARESYARAWGFTPQEQIDIEQWNDNLVLSEKVEVVRHTQRPWSVYHETTG